MGAGPILPLFPPQAELDSININYTFEFPIKCNSTCYYFSCPDYNYKRELHTVTVSKEIQHPYFENDLSIFRNIIKCPRHLRGLQTQLGIATINFQKSCGLFSSGTTESDYHGKLFQKEFPFRGSCFNLYSIVPTMLAPQEQIKI